MSRLLITLTVITSTLFTTQIPDHLDDTPKEAGLSTLEQKKKSLGLGSFMRNSRNDASSQKYFNGNRSYMTSVNDGRIGQNYEIEEAGGRWPRGQSQNTIWSAGLWIGSQMYGEPRVSGVVWNESSFTPGVLDGDPYSDEARVLKVNRWDDEGSSEDYADWASYDFTPKIDSDGSDNYSLSFDGSSDYVLIPYDNSFNVNNLTIEAWVYSGNFNQNGFIFEKGPINSQYSLFFEGLNLTFRTQHSGNSENNFVINSSDIGFTSNTWHHLAASYDGTTKKIFVDGSLVASTACTGALLSNTAGSIIGAYGGSGAHHYNFSGLIDEIEVWNIALTESEIQENMFNNLTGNENGLVGYWNFNEGEGTTLTDISGNGNNGTIYDATWSEDVPEPPASPEILLDQSLFTIYSDDGERRAEIRQTIYGGMTDDPDNPIKDAVFLHYEIENRSDSAWVETYMSFFCDWDLGS